MFLPTRRDVHLTFPGLQNGQRQMSRGSVYGVAGERRRIAKILHVVMAVPTSSIDTAQPAHTNSRSHGQGSVSLDDIAYDLMSRDQVGKSRRKFSFDNVQVSTTNAAGTHAQ